MNRFARKALIVLALIALILAALWAYGELAARYGLFWVP